MSILKNYFSKIYHNDIGEAFSILVYIDIDGIVDEKMIINYMNTIVVKNPILKQTMVEENNVLILNTIEHFDINQYYTIKYNKSKNFNFYITKLLNEKFNTELKWKFLWCIDKDSNKSRYYFKIHHAYADGYKLIQILSSPFKEADISKQLKRETSFLDTLYYYFIGTIVLLIFNIKIMFNLLYKKDVVNINNNKTDYLICKKLKLQKIKEYTKKHNITINDFLYFLMIKTDKLYRKDQKELTTISLVNISGIKQTNNVCPIINTIHNSENDNLLKTNIHNIFNNLKYSLFVPLLNYFLSFVSECLYIDSLSDIYNTILNKADYVFSNLIGPSIKDITYFSIKDVHFLTTSKNNEIMYNIISCEDCINIICSFKEGVIKNKKKFKKCIYKTYLDIINEIN
jgi:hypothetical protein